MRDLLLLFLFCCFITSLKAQTYTLTDDDVIVENGVIKSCSYNFENTDIIIPEKLDGQTVIAIGDGENYTGVFMFKGITSVRIPSTIISIGEFAFEMNDLSSIDLSYCTTLISIGASAFKYNEILNLDISNCIQLELIDENAFSQNKLISLDLSGCQNLKVIGYHAFYSNILSSVNLLGCTSMTKIGNEAFGANYYLDGFSLPSVSKFETYGWKDGNNHSYFMGDQVTDKYTFYWIPIPYTITDDNVIVENGTIVSCSYNFEKSDIIIPETLDDQTILAIGNTESTAIFASKGITSIRIPYTIQSIGNSAFSSNSISNLDLSENTNLKYIGNSAFSENNLMDVNLSDCIALIKIKESAFRNNEISNLNLSGCSQLKFIDDNAFYNNKLTNIDISGCTSLTKIGKEAFESNNLLESFALPIIPGYESLGWKDMLNRSFNMGETVTDKYTSYRVPIPYTLTNDDVIVENGVIKSCSYNFELTDIIIPQILDGQTVIGIDDENSTINYRGVFEEGIITSVSFPQTIQYIGNSAFRNTKIASIDLSGNPNLLKIGAASFSNGILKFVDLSSCTALKSIGAEAFKGNEISSLNLSGCSQLNIINEYAFYSNNLDSLDLSGCIALDTIGKEAFSENKISSLNLSKCFNLKIIDNCAFCSNRLASLDLSSCQSLKTIGAGAFGSNKLTSIDLSGCTALTIIGEGAFNYNSLSNGFNLPTNSEYVEYGWKDGNNRTYSMGDLVTDTYARFWIPIPYTLTNDDVVVENGIIESCSYNFELTDIIIPQYLDGQTVIAIAGFDFWNIAFASKGITSVDIPSSVQSIGNFAFSNNLITSINFSGNTNLTQIGNSAFYNNRLADVDLSGCTSLDTIQKSAFEWNEISNLNLADCNHLKLIDDRAFNTNKLESLDLAGCPNLHTIGSYTFYNNKLTDIDLSGCTTLTKIGQETFDSNNLLKSFTLPIIHGYETIGWKDMHNRSFNMGEQVTDKYTYYWVPIPYTFTDDDVIVENGVIKSCSYNFEFTDIIIPEVLDGQTIVAIDNDEDSVGVFQNKGITSVLIPHAVNSIGNEAFSGNSLFSIDLSKNINFTNIGNSAFYQNKLTQVNLSGCIALDTIGSFAFYENKLDSLNLSRCAALVDIGESAFCSNEISKLNITGCSQLKIIDKYAFSNNKIDSLDLKGCMSLGRIGENAFENNEISYLNLAGCSQLSLIDKNAFNGNKLDSLELSTCPNIKTIGYRAFYGNALTTIDLSKCTTLTKIDQQAFDLNDSLHEYILPSITGYEIIGWKDGNNNFYKMGDHVFDKSTYYWVPILYTLTDDDVVVKNGVIESCSYNFERTDIVIPQILDGQTIEAINGKINYSGIFSEKGITSIQLPKTIEKIGVRAFESNSIINLDFSNCISLNKIDFNAFSQNNIRSLKLNNCSNLKIIDEGAFQHNYLRVVQMDGCISLERIGRYAFNNNNELDSINLTNSTSLLKIGEYAFSQCNFKNFNLPGATDENYFYNQWNDDYGNKYKPEEEVDLYRNYARNMPVIEEIAPKIVLTSGNEEISIHGVNFETSRNNKTILFNGIESLNYTHWSDTLIKVICPPNLFGSATISIALLNDITHKSSKQLFYSNDDIITICGEVSGVWETGKTYYMTCNCSVLEDDTLMIKPGVKILSDPSVMPQLSIYGTVNAIGTSEQPILFSSFGPSSWNGINVIGTFARSRFRHCIVENSMTGFRLAGGSYGCNDYDNSSLIENCIIRNNSNDGIYAIAKPAIYGCSIIKAGTVRATIKYCQIYNNGEDGIECLVNGSSSAGYIGLNIINNLIFNNYNGILCRGGNVEPKIINNTIANNIHYGLITYQNVEINPDSFKIANNIFAGNSYGMRNLANRYLKAMNNLFSSNETNYAGKINHKNTIEKDAVFVDISSNDYQLRAISPCIDAGSNNFVDFEKDLDNKIRIWNWDIKDSTTVDIGAYEFDAPCNYTKSNVEICNGESYEGETTSGTYRIILQNSCDCDSVIDVTLTVYELPDKPFIAAEDTTLTSSSPNGNQWFIEQTRIEGATNQTYSVEKTGNYSVQVTSDKGCISEMSDHVTVQLTSVIEINYQVQVYPIPTTGILQIEGLFQNENTVISIFNVMGQKIGHKELNKMNSTINLSLYEKGTYYLTFNNSIKGAIKIIKE